MVHSSLQTSSHRGEAGSTSTPFVLNTTTQLMLHWPELNDEPMEGFYMESLFQVVICLAKDWGLHYHERRGKHILRGNLQSLHLAKDFINALEHLFLFLITAQKKELSWVFIDNSYLATLLQSFN